MDTVTQQFTVADFCAMLARRELTVNTDYQRSNKVWPDTARSFLIETILLGFPIPKLAVHQRTDLKSRRTLKEIVDGQQRSKAILDFYNNDLRLASAIETPAAQGRRYDDLDEEFQHRFLDYGLNVDLFVGATEADVREAFRRINSFTAPLNPEEQRHAEFQGPFKWFIHRLTRRYDQSLEAWGVFTVKSLARMRDSKLYTEVAHAVLNGITTTDTRALKAFYKRFEKAFPQEVDLETYFDGALSEVATWTEVHGTALMKPYNLYSALLAVIHVQHDVEALRPVARRKRMVGKATKRANLAVLADAAEVDDPEEAGDLEPFAEATSKGTNVKAAREERFRWFVAALTEKSIG
jgi:hypothetical protein